MSKRLVSAGAESPDDHCSSCGAGIFYDLPRLGAPTHQLAHSSQLLKPVEETEFVVYDPPALFGCGHHLCELCYAIESELIATTNSKLHPERLASYERMQERFS